MNADVHWCNQNLMFQKYSVFCYQVYYHLNEIPTVTSFGFFSFSKRRILEVYLCPLRLSRDGTLPDFLTAESFGKKNFTHRKTFQKNCFGWLGERRPSPQYGYRSRPPHHWDYSPAADNFKWNLVKVKLKIIIPQKLTLSSVH